MKIQDCLLFFEVSPSSMAALPCLLDGIMASSLCKEGTLNYNSPVIKISRSYAAICCQNPFSRLCPPLKDLF